MRALGKSENNIVYLQKLTFKNENAEHCFLTNNLSHYEMLIITAVQENKNK